MIRLFDILFQALSELKIGGGKEKLVDVSSDDMTISYLAARNPFVSVLKSCSLADVCAALVEKHCHRVPIVDEESGKCTNIISQSALVKYLAKHGKLRPAYRPTVSISITFHLQLLTLVFVYLFFTYTHMLSHVVD